MILPGAWYSCSSMRGENSVFHWLRRNVDAQAGSNNALDEQERGEEERTQHSTGLGISLYDFMEQFEESMAPRIAEDVTLSCCAQFELVTLRIVPGRTYAAEEEIEQHVAVSTDGTIRFRTNTYHHGPGRLGIGRVQEATIPRAVVQEICRMLDTWLYTRKEQSWSPSADAGKWYLRVRFENGLEQVQRGELGGAFLEGIDVSQFLRERIPIPGLYLFDQDI